MRTVIQRVSQAEVAVVNNTIGQISNGLLVLAAFSPADAVDDLQWMAKKICGLRIFRDEHDNMNLSLRDVAGDLLIVSQFTLLASTKKGNRPSFENSAKADVALLHYQNFLSELAKRHDKPIQTGQFGATMHVRLCNDGPVTIIIDSRDRV